MPSHKRPGYHKRPGVKGSPNRNNNQNENSRKTDDNVNAIREERTRFEWFEEGVKFGKSEAVQMKENLASREQRLRQDEAEAVEREERLKKREQRLSDWQQRLSDWQERHATEKELSQVEEELQTQRTKVIKSLRAQLQKQLEGTAGSTRKRRSTAK